VRSREQDVGQLVDMTAYGCPSVFDHPLGPTGHRSVAGLIGTPWLGGAAGLFTSCTAGDADAAPALEVTE
jgi:hypothetical protein